MNKSELVKTLSETCFLNPDDAEAIVSIFFNSIKKALLEDDRVEIRGFGSFKIKVYPEYSGRNPKTGEQVIVGTKKLPFFRLGKELKEYINS